VVIPLHALEQTVKATIIDRFDHRNLNLEVDDFKSTIPSVENIAKVIFQHLKPRFASPRKLVAVKVWETPKTWCEYSEPV
jgi:6-pyruvoyltetrahydropterin/6-carboxytetrahydropterin synthase